jgi:hypothetical protein
MPRPLFSGKIIDAKSALNEQGVLGPEVAKAEATALYVAFGAGTTAGSVIIEGSHAPGYTGTWEPIATVAWSAATKVNRVVVTGPHIALRARVSVAVVGGSVDVYAHVTG